MKKILALSLAVLMTASIFAGCGKKEQIVINSAEDLNGKKIGVQTGTTGETWVNENTKNSDIVSMKTGMDAALDLKNGALDAVVLDELPAKAIVEKNPELKILDIKFAKEEYAIAVKKGNKELLASIDATIKAIKDNGDYEALVNAFMPADGNIKIPETKLSAGSKVVKLGTNAAFPPFEYVEGTKVVGFDITMGEKIAYSMDAKLVVEDMNFDSLIPALSSGAIDFVAAGMSVTEERKQNVDFSVPYFESEQVIIVRK